MPVSDPLSDQSLMRNSARERMANNELAVGMLIRLARSGDVVRIAKSSGHDFVFVDIQHALNL